METIIAESHVFLQLSSVLVDLHHVVVKTFKVDVLVQGHAARQLPIGLLLRCLLAGLRIVDLGVAVLDEFLPELAHTIRVLSLGRIAKEAGSPLLLDDLTLRVEI